MPHLLIVSIGPVQGFIAAARKARDLWFGSTMLSEISHAAASSLVDDFGAEIIFPSPNALKSDTAVANKILAIVDRAAPGEIAAHTRSVAQARLAHPDVQTGVFAADMQVHLVNDGPVTIPMRIPSTL